MNEKPILFSGQMVRAILEGRKTQTRRILNRVSGEFPNGKITQFGISDTKGYDFTFRDKSMLWHDFKKDDFISRKCPYGGPGTVLWVRETFASGSGYVWYKADCDNGPAHEVCQFPDGSEPAVKWKPSIHMPRRASRINLLVKNVRVERLRDISEEDARAEGVIPIPGGVDYKWLDKPYRSEFATLWNSINEKRGYGWDTNPWVWVVEFERVEL